MWIRRQDWNQVARVLVNLKADVRRLEELEVNHRNRLKELERKYAVPIPAEKAPHGYVPCEELSLHDVVHGLVKKVGLTYTRATTV